MQRVEAPARVRAAVESARAEAAARAAGKRSKQRPPTRAATPSKTPPVARFRPAGRVKRPPRRHVATELRRGGGEGLPALCCTGEKGGERMAGGVRIPLGHPQSSSGRPNPVASPPAIPPCPPVFGYGIRPGFRPSRDRRERVPPYLGGTGAYWGPISVLWGRNGGPEPNMKSGRSSACARAAQAWATSLHVTYSRRLETARQGDWIPLLVAHL